MFIGIMTKVKGRSVEPAMEYFDASRIIKIAANPDGEGCLFWFDDSDVGGAMCYEAISYEPDGLVELALQARLHPAQFLPSLIVGKDNDDTPSSTGSLHWSAKRKG